MMKPLPTPKLVQNDPNHEDEVQQSVIDNASLFSCLCSLIYQTRDIIKWKLGVDEENEKNRWFIYFDDCLTTQGFIVRTVDPKNVEEVQKTLDLKGSEQSEKESKERKKEDVIVVFRGSEIETHRAIYEDWFRIDLQIRQVLFSEGQPGKGKIHSGFAQGVKNVWDADRARELNERLTGEKRKIWFTGHSLGGALASLAAARWADSFGTDNIGGVYTFGSPKCGNKKFVSFYNDTLGLKNITFRFVNERDPAPAVPITEPSFKGQMAFFTAGPLVHVLKVVGEGYPLFKLLGKGIWNVMDFAADFGDVYYDHVGCNPYYLDDKKKIYRGVPPTLARLWPRSIWELFNPKSLMDGILDHDYKEYVKKIAGNETIQLKTDCYKKFFHHPFEEKEGLGIEEQKKCAVM